MDDVGFVTDAPKGPVQSKEDPGADPFNWVIDIPQLNTAGVLSMDKTGLALSSGT